MPRPRWKQLVIHGAAASMGVWGFVLAFEHHGGDVWAGLLGAMFFGLGSGEAARTLLYPGRR